LSPFVTDNLSSSNKSAGLTQRTIAWPKSL
jgi:hypothetical protein